jgi:hypothetical protein
MVKLPQKRLSMNKHSELVINGEKQESSEDETTDVSDI